MLIKELLVVALLSASCLASCTAHAVHKTYSGCQKPPVPRELTLCEEFQLIRDLAPHDSIISLVKSHMENDLRFRKAVQYMQSTAFRKTTNDIDATATFQSILRRFVRADVNTTDINSVYKIFECVLKPIIEEAIADSRSVQHPEQLVESRNLCTFAEAAARLIPTQDLIDTLETQLGENANFAKFYEVVRKPTFYTKVMESFTNRDVSGSIKKLRRQQIYLSELTKYAFNIFNLGPAVDD